MARNSFGEKPHLCLALVAAVGFISGCSMYADPPGPRAVGVISPTSVAAAAAMNPQGIVRFQQRGDGVFVTGRISGLRPNQEHGFHVHEGSDCSGDALGTKGHFNPDSAPHGRHGSASHHAGDLPALKANADGIAEINVLVKKLTVAAGPASVVGKGLIVHRDPDDYTTQPTGNAGPRPGCAVIRAD